MLDDGQVSANDNNQYSVPLSTTTSDGEVETANADDGADGPDAPDSPDAPDAGGIVGASGSGIGKTDAPGGSNPADTTESGNNVSTVRGVREVPAPYATPEQIADVLREKFVADPSLRELGAGPLTYEVGLTGFNYGPAHVERALELLEAAA